MMRRAVTLGAAIVLTSGALGAQAPTIEKMDPPNWWARHTINPVRVLVRGTNLTGARAMCGALACGPVRVNANGTSAFVDVTIPAAARAGAHSITLTTPRGSARGTFTVSTPLPAAGRFQGFGVNDVIYLIMPDRFANGDTTNDRTAKSPGITDRTKRRWYHGGDLAGIRAKLPYLRDLGITAIWLNPIYDNNDREDTKEVYDGQTTTGYHGYGATDFYAVDEHLGTVDEFRALVDDAHKAGIKVILDMVANHTGPYHPWVKDPPTPTWFHGTEANHPNNTWQTWTLASAYANPAMRQATLDGWFVNILPDFNQDDPEVARYITQNTLWWVGISGIDGIRQDTWPYVPTWYWRDWMSAIKRQYPAVKVVGEVLDGDPTMIRFFEGTHRAPDGIRTGVDKMFDFPIHFVARDVFARGGSIRNLAQMLARDHLYDDPMSLVTLIGLHDVPRFMGETGATVDGLKLAFTFLLTTRGTPLVYYGDEIAMMGGGDPDNRKDFPGGWRGDARDAFTPTGRTAGEQGVFTHTQTLLRLRAQQTSLRSGRTEHLLVTDQQFVYRRGAITVAINNDTTAADVSVPVPVAGRDVLATCATPTTGGRLRIPARRSCVFAP